MAVDLLVIRIRTMRGDYDRMRIAQEATQNQPAIS
jgi:hypothetical protein